MTSNSTIERERDWCNESACRNRASVDNENPSVVRGDKP